MLHLYVYCLRGYYTRAINLATTLGVDYKKVEAMWKQARKLETLACQGFKDGVNHHV
jgi:hypothetical protein